MNIGIDARLWNESGVGRYTRNVVKGLEKRNTSHTFTIFLNECNYREVNFLNPSFRKVRANSRWHTLSEQWEFKKILEQENLDLVHFPYFSHPVFYKRPFVITIHDLIIDHYPTGRASSLPLPMYYLKHFAYKKIIKNGIKNSRKIIVPSMETKKELIHHYNANSSKIEMIYEGFDALIKKPTNKAPLVSKNYILYVGNAYPHKNLQKLIEAYKIISKSSNIELVCIGKSDFFYKKIEQGKVRGMYFLHDVDDSLLFEYYTNATMLVMPTLMEGFGLPVLEAMSLSCPVVCSDIDILKEIVEDAALYFDPKNPADIARAIVRLNDDEKLREELIQKGLKQTKKFSWEKCVDKTLKIYESSNSV